MRVRVTHNIRYQKEEQIFSLKYGTLFYTLPVQTLPATRLMAAEQRVKKIYSFFFRNPALYVNRVNKFTL